MIEKIYWDMNPSTLEKWLSGRILMAKRIIFFVLVTDPLLRGDKVFLKEQ